MENSGEYEVTELLDNDEVARLVYDLLEFPEGHLEAFEQHDRRTLTIMTRSALKPDKSLETLKGFHELKLKPFEHQLARNYSGSGMNSPLTSHLNQMLEAAYRKHETWKQKKVKR